MYVNVEFVSSLEVIVYSNVIHIFVSIVSLFHFSIVALIMLHLREIDRKAGVKVDGSIPPTTPFSSNTVHLFAYILTSRNT